MFLVRFVDEGTRVESYLAVCFVLVYIFGDKKKERPWALLFLYAGPFAGFASCGPRGPTFCGMLLV